MRIAALLIALASLGCGLTGPDEDLSGHWVASVHTDLIELTLLQSGDEITGTACQTSQGRLIYSGADVTGSYPNLQFTVRPTNVEPCCSGAGLHFSGKQDGSKDIVGTYANIDGLRFKRSSTTRCN